MFTGLISAIGKVVKYDGTRPPHNRRASAERCGGRLGIRVPFSHVRLGESLSVDGVCLTVAFKESGTVFFDVGPETRRVTTLGGLKPGSRVNMERALRVGDRVGGHWVTGHVEQTGRLVKVKPAGRSRWIEVIVPHAVARYVVPKGSLAVDGVSLTVADVQKNKITIMLIPHTLSHTTLGQKKSGDKVNVEADLLAKYAEQLQKLRG